MCFWTILYFEKTGIGKTTNTANILISYQVEYAPVIDHACQLNH